MALSKVILGAKQISYIRESAKTVIEKLMETSITNALDKKAEWAKQIKDVEDADLMQAMKDTLNNTKGKHGRRTFQQEEQGIDDILIADDKQALKEAILMALNDMEHEYKPHISRPHSSVLIILNRTLPFPYSSVPSALSQAESTSMTLPKGLIPSSITMKRSSLHPRTQSGNVEEKLCRI